MCFALFPGANALSVEKADRPSESATDAPDGRKKDAEDLVADYEQLRKQVEDLTGALAAASITIDEMTSTNRLSRLVDMERKAFEYDALSVKLRLKDQEIARLTRELKVAREAIAEQAARISLLSIRTNEMSRYVSKLEGEQAPLKEALRLIRLGRYEYYEIKKGDTCESIAAQAAVYGDAKKHVLIRQANRASVEDLDSLVPGEMLVIPRFSVSGRYEL